MLKSRMPVYLCSTAFSLATFSATDRRASSPLTPEKTSVHKTISYAAASSFGTSGGNTLDAAPGKQAMKFVRHYIRNNNECLLNVRERSEVPFSIIDSVFSHYGLPHELKYLAVIESELKTSAVSP